MRLSRLIAQTISVCVAMTLGLCAVRSTVAEVARAAQGMVATVHPLATGAGVAALEQGGNAVDAAVAAALTLGVVDGYNSGIGGGCLILLRSPDGQLLAVDGRETAPARAHRDMFLQDGTAQTEWSQTGPLAVATPGALAAYDEVIRRHGRLALRDLLLPAARVAEEGFPISAGYEKSLKESAAKLAKYPGSREVLLKGDGEPYVAGDLLRQPDLARTYRAVAEQGIAWFYGGPFARTVGAWMSENGGFLTAEDFANYRPIQREPIRSQYRGHTIVGFPPPSSGGTHVAQILNMLEHFDLRQLHQRDPAQFAHVVAEAMKLAFADRAHWLGDADFVAVPRGLVDPDYAAALARRINPDRPSTVPRHGQPPRADSDLFRRHTTHIAAADAAGYWVAITATVNTTFGSKVIVPGTGVVLNNEMDDFSIQPGVPNAFGLVGAEANAVAPGKRPLSSMSPTIVLRDGRPVMTVGAAGGPTIITQVVLAIVNHIDLQLPLDTAIAAPRFHHQWSPDRIAIEQSMPADLREKLAARGHELRILERIGVTQAIGVSEDGRLLVGVHDPRVQGQAAGR